MTQMLSNPYFMPQDRGVELLMRSRPAARSAMTSIEKPTSPHLPPFTPSPSASATHSIHRTTLIEQAGAEVSLVPRIEQIEMVLCQSERAAHALCRCSGATPPRPATPQNVSSSTRRFSSELRRCWSHLSTQIKFPGQDSGEPIDHGAKILLTPKIVNKPDTVISDLTNATAISKNSAATPYCFPSTGILPS